MRRIGARGHAQSQPRTHQVREQRRGHRVGTVGAALALVEAVVLVELGLVQLHCWLVGSVRVVLRLHERVGSHTHTTKPSKPTRPDPRTLLLLAGEGPHGAHGAQTLLRDHVRLRQLLLCGLRQGADVRAVAVFGWGLGKRALIGMGGSLVGGTYTRLMTTMAGTETKATRLSFQLWRKRKMSVPTACTVVVVFACVCCSGAMSGVRPNQMHARASIQTPQKHPPTEIA